MELKSSSSSEVEIGVRLAFHNIIIMFGMSRKVGEDELVVLSSAPPRGGVDIVIIAPMVPRRRLLRMETSVSSSRLRFMLANETWI